MTLANDLAASSSTTLANAAVANTTLVGRAVHQNRLLSLDGLYERIFTIAFSKLVYAQIWEDPVVDLEALALTPDSRIVTISSGGCNALSYLTQNPARIFAVDLNATHVALVRLKLAALQQFSTHEEYFSLFGASNSATSTRAYDQVLRPSLDATSRAYWDGLDMTGRRRIKRFSRGIYRYGLLGRFIGAAHILARLHGRNPRRMLEARTVAEQRALFESELAPIFDKPLVKRLLDNPMSLFGLGIPPAQYRELCGDQPSASAVVRARLQRLACDFDLKDNYFAWQAFNRGYAADGKGPVPLYLQPAHFALTKANASRLSIEQVSYVDFLERQPTASLDRYVLLDAQDWMDNEALNRLWSEITRTSKPRARVIFRTAAANTMLPGRVSEAILKNWHYEHEQSLDLHKRDRSAIYGGFHLYVLKSSPES
jgi:S-adenosylmethionine-diacylglycerol 3-amino-3-carboxypropyl transferase